ncbi:MAG: CBS domain-containing protein [Methanobacteriota archaeon]|nr:MAG: CBS domain-containing protein [Euryarchaeota archaeon]
MGSWEDLDFIKRLKASDVMLSNQVNSVAVKRDGVIVGLLTDKDFLRAFTSMEDFKDRRVSELMLPSLVAVNPDMSLIEATERMGKNNVTHLFVRDQGEIVGLISLKDVLNVFYGAVVEAVGR